MLHKVEENFYEELKIDCEKCFGLCCIALYFSKSEGFPNNKEAGKACINLQNDFTCSVHKSLKNKGLKGCIAYDCFGAGQKVAQITFNGENWSKNSNIKEKMFDAFLIMRQLHEMLWYLSQAVNLQTNKKLKENINLLINETRVITNLELEDLLKIDIDEHRNKVNIFLKETSELIRSKAINKNKSKRLDYFGSDLRKMNLKGADLRGACLIAANLSGVDLSFADLIGSDLRDTNLSGANLENSIFLTQGQVNAAKGDLKTKLPKMITRPSHWEK